MQNMITDEFIRYKSGFMLGKHQAIEMIKMGIRTDLSDDSNNNDEWSNYGFEDGFEYYFDQINKEVPFDNINTREIIEKKFYERVEKVNKESNKEIPVSRFRI